MKHVSLPNVHFAGMILCFLGAAAPIVKAADAPVTSAQPESPAPRPKCDLSLDPLIHAIIAANAPAEKGAK